MRSGERHNTRKRRRSFIAFIMRERVNYGLVALSQRVDVCDGLVAPAGLALTGVATVALCSLGFQRHPLLYMA